MRNPPSQKENDIKNEAGASEEAKDQQADVEGEEGDQKPPEQADQAIVVWSYDRKAGYSAGSLI